MVSIWFLVSAPWFGLTAKMGMWRPEGKVTGAPDPPAGAGPPSEALGLREPSVGSL